MSEQLDRIEVMLRNLTDSGEATFQKVQTQKLIIDMLSYMAIGKQIEAIKICRQLCGVSLKEAKDLVVNARHVS